MYSQYTERASTGDLGDMADEDTPPNTTVNDELHAM